MAAAAAAVEEEVEEVEAVEEEMGKSLHPPQHPNQLRRVRHAGIIYASWGSIAVIHPVGSAPPMGGFVLSKFVILRSQFEVYVCCDLVAFALLAR